MTTLSRLQVASSIDRFIDQAVFGVRNSTFPPYNIEKTGEFTYKVTYALAGFSADEIDVDFDNGYLTVKSLPKQEDDNRHYLHRGIARRAFEHQLRVNRDIRIANEATFENGLLTLSLEHIVPDELKARKIAIRSSHLIDAKPANDESASEVA